MRTDNGLTEFARVLCQEQIEQLRKDHLDCQSNINNSMVTVKHGRKWTRVDVGPSGKYLVNPEGEIFEIKAYGVPNLKRKYGTLDTIHHYYWGDYRAILKTVNGDYR